MENFTVIDFQRARDFSQKMGVIFEFVKQNFKSLSRCLLFIAGPPVAIGGIFIGDIFYRLINFTVGEQRTSAGGMDIEEYFTSMIFLLQLVGILGFMWIGGVVTIATVYGYMQLYREKQSPQIEVSEVWALVRRTFWRYFGTLTAYFFLSMVAFTILSIPLMIVVGISTTISPFLTIFFVFGFYVMIGLTGVNLSMIFIIRGNEDVSFFQGLQRLIFLVRGKVWSTFGIGAINTLIQSTVSGIFLIPWYVILILTFLHMEDSSKFEEPTIIMNAVSSLFLILYFVCNVLLYTLPLLAMAFQYYNLVELKEARGLMSNLETFGEATVPKQVDEHY